MDNNNVLNVTLDELPNNLKELVITTVNQYQEKYLLSFTKNKDRKVIEKTLLPRVIMEGEHDLNLQIQYGAMHETMSKAIATTLANHNKIFLNGKTNVIKKLLV